MLNKKFNFVGNFKLYGIISLAIISIGLIIALVLGPVMDITFIGGTKITYSYTGKVDEAKVEQLAKKTIGSRVTVDTSSSYDGKTKKITVSLAENKSLDADLIDKLTKDLSTDKTLKANKITQEEILSVSPTVGGVFFAKCLVAVIISALLVIIYVAFRFRKIGGWLAGSATMVALVHDILIAFSASVVFRLPIDANFIAVVMTLLGYSLNSTIVVFDRVRENRRRFGSKETLHSLVNMSNNQVLSRNVMTNISTVLSIVIVLIVCEVCGITALRSLTVPLCFGLVSGAYSSICIAPPLWVVWKQISDQAKQKKALAKKGSK